MMNGTKVLSLAVAGTLLGVACSPSAGPSGGSGGSTAPTVGGGQGLGGSLVGAGGSLVGAGGSVVGAGGLVSSGGAVVSAGGAATAGGAAAVGGASGEITCSGTSGAITSNYVDNGTWCGYAFTAAWDTATVMPAEFDSTATELCVTGSVPAEVPADATAEPPVTGVYPGLSIGFGIREMGTTKGTWTVAGTSVTVDAVAEGVSATDLGAIRLMFEPVAAPPETAEGASKDVGYAYWLPAGTTFPVTVPFADFTSLPWIADGTAVTGQEVSKFSIQIGGRESGPQTITNFCLTSVTVNP